MLALPTLGWAEVRLFNLVSKHKERGGLDSYPAITKYIQRTQKTERTSLQTFGQKEVTMEHQKLPTCP